MDKIDYQNVVMESSFGYACYRLILDEKGVPVDYVYIEVNRAFENITGISRNKIIGKRATELFYNADSETLERIQLYGCSVLKQEKIVLEQYSDFLRKWYRVEITPREDLHFVTLFFDITELKESTAKLKQYMEYAPDCIFIADKNGRYISVNPAACTLLGYSQDEFLTMSIKDITPP